MKTSTAKNWGSIVVVVLLSAILCIVLNGKQLNLTDDNNDNFDVTPKLNDDRLYKWAIGSTDVSVNLGA